MDLARTPNIYPKIDRRLGLLELYAPAGTLIGWVDYSAREITPSENLPPLVLEFALAAAAVLRESFKCPESS